ncbi:MULTISPECIES: HAD family hydrolase [unclassified Pseudonocardia]|uniref:HAD family hydrolase n=1 Tax=unclassified Pseudonocardia TaxID=2619320 RepID=UPI000B2C58F7|nr:MULTISPECIES: HAD family hydrolase [unclassified Pseudonocardia]
MRRPVPVPAAVAAVAALLLPLAGPVVPPSAHPGVLVGAVLLGAAVVCGAGRHGHRAAARALRQGSVTADAGVSLATLPALTWSGFALLTPALGGPGAPTGIRDPGALLTGPSLLPGIAAVLTVVALAVRVTGRSDDDGPGEDALGAAADRWCVRMVPVTALLALAVAGFRAGTGRPWDDAATAAVAVLLAGCPLVLLAAVPAAVRAADRACGTAVRLPLPAAGRPDPVGWTAPHRGPRPADRVDTVALAGPEVLTGAVPAPLVVHPARGEDTATVLRLAGSVATGIAAGSDLGPLGRALAAQAPDALPDVAEADERPGLGMSGLVAELLPAPDDGSAPPGAGIGTLERSSPTVVAHAVLLGAPAWLLEHGIGLPADLAVQRERAEAEGHAIVAAAWDGTARAVLELTRSPHDGAGPGLDALRAAGTEPVLLTPDDDGPARALAAAAGLDPADPDAVRPGLDPGGRAAAVAGLRVRGRTVAVAADPGTDPAALDRADLAVELHPRAPGPAAPDPVPAPAGGSARIVARGGPAEVATALELARRARAHARSGIVAGVVVGAAAVVAAVAGAPAVPVAAVPVLGAAAVRVRRIRPGR